jgi:hypothetical protein
MDKEELQAISDTVDILDVECDGATRLCHLLLINRGIRHKTFVGRVEDKSGNVLIGFHLWTVAGEFTIDCRLKQWIKDRDVPNGVFKQSECELVYVGNPVDLDISGCLILSAIYKVR